MSEQVITPSPGSPEAVEKGCTCPVMDNHNGEGFPYGGDGPCFWTTEGCPLHMPAQEAK